jgi:3-methyl-2-oxobutanoate hydroxymethyltransferase
MVEKTSVENILAKPGGLSFFSARTATNDPFVYRLGLQVFILARRVRLPYGSPFLNRPPPKRGFFVSRTSFAFPVTTQQKAEALKARKGGRPIAMLTAYDYPTARLLDESGIDALLVGDSLGMVVLGFPDTTHVTLEHMLHHVAAVARAKPAALIIGDLPIHTYETPEQALETARKLVAAGSEAVKLEGGIRQADKVRAITAAGIPVIGHLGMLPQRVLEEGGYRKKGKTPEQADAIREGAEALIEAGVSAIVFESIIPETARLLSQSLAVPTIGVGCGDRTCDGEVAVVTDLLGSYPWFVPPFAKPEADLAAITREAVAKYVARVRTMIR